MGIVSRKPDYTVWDKGIVSLWDKGIVSRKPDPYPIRVWLTRD